MLFPAIETSFDYLCFSYILFASPSERGDFMMSFMYDLYMICDSHEKTVNMEKETFCCHITYHLCKQQNWVGLHSFRRPWRKQLASMA